jgi:hypothetical protein
MELLDDLVNEANNIREAARQVLDPSRSANDVPDVTSGTPASAPDPSPRRQYWSPFEGHPDTSFGEPDFELPEGPDLDWFSL